MKYKLVCSPIGEREKVLYEGDLTKDTVEEELERIIKKVRPYIRGRLKKALKNALPKD